MSAKTRLAALRLQDWVANNAAALDNFSEGRQWLQDNVLNLLTTATDDEDIITTEPLDVRAIAEESDYDELELEGVLALSLGDLLNLDIEGLNDIACKQIVDSYLFQDLQYTVIGTTEDGRILICAVGSLDRQDLD